MTSKDRTLLLFSPSAYLLGGLATWLDYLLPGLASKGWRPVLALVSGPRHHDPRRYLECHPWDDWIEVPCGPATPTAKVRSSCRAIRRVNPEAVITVNVPHALIASSSIRPVRRPAAIMSCHGIVASLFSDMAVLRSILDGVVLTNRLAQRLAQTVCGIEPRRALYAPYGTALPLAATPIRAGGNPLRVSYVGRLEEDQKRVHDLVAILEALERLSCRVHLRLAGEGPERVSLLGELESKKWRHTVEWLGVVPSSAVGDRVLKQTDILVLTSTWETGPIVVWEAMAHGVPVVSSRYVGSGLERALTHERNCLLYEIGDTSDAARQIHRLATDPDLARSIAREGRRLVESRYSHEASVSQWDAALRHALELPRTTAAIDPGVWRRPAGRLDRWLAGFAADRIRACLKRSAPDNGPSGEWPHAISGCSDWKREFWRDALRLDRPSGEMLPEEFSRSTTR